jgi:hypothetical protein
VKCETCSLADAERGGLGCRRSLRSLHGIGTDSTCSGISSGPVCELCGNASRTSSADGSSRGIGLVSLVIPTCAPLWPTPTAGDYRGSRNATARRPNGNGRHNSGVTLTDALILSGELPLPKTGIWPKNVPCPCRCHTSTSSAAASPARTSASPDAARGSTGHARVFGPSTPDSFATYDPATSSWRTSQLSLLEEWSVFSETWPRAGMTRSGTASRLRPLAPLTGGTGSGSLPTPNARDWKDLAGSPAAQRRKSPGLATMAAANMWPTPKSSPSGPDYARMNREGSGGDDLATAVARETGGSLNPTWVEWLMGFPLGWTDLERSATPSSLRSPNGSAGASSKPKG